MLVPVNVQFPTSPLGIVIAPVDTVTSPELDRVVLTVREFDPLARVSPAPSESVVAVIAPDEVNVLLFVVESRVRVEYVAVGIVLVSVNVHTPDEALGIDIAPVDTVMVPELVSVVLTVSELEPTL